MSNVKCETKNISMSELLRKFNEKEIMKPKIQRSACWAYHHTEDKTNCQDFIKFISENKNLINPLIFVERECDGKNRLFTIDGNNRLNAIVRFINKPFDMFPELIDICFNGSSKEFLKTCSYEQIMRRAVSELFTDKNLLQSNYNKINQQEEISNKFTSMKDKLAEMKFMEITVPITQFQNIDEEKIVSIYSGLNRNGIKLTEQDILASTASFIKFEEKDLDHYNILKENIIKFYNDVNDKEVLKVEFNEPSLNLFEVLNALQIEIYKKYKFIPEKQVAISKYDLTFSWYKYIFNGFNKVNGPVMNEFINKILTIMNMFQEINSELYGSKINCSSLTCYTINLPRTYIGALILYAYRNFDKLEESRKIVKNCVMYYEIWNSLDPGQKKQEFKSRDPLKLASIVAKLHEIITIAPCPKQYMEEMIYYQLKTSLKLASESPKTRRKVNKLYSILLTSYFAKVMPDNMKIKPNQAEHIIPFSSRWKPDCIDIDRLGNLTLLDEDLNKKRGKTRIRDSYIKENKLEYLKYPSEDQYNTIVNDLGLILSTNEYNKICVEREKFYVEVCLNDLY